MQRWRIIGFIALTLLIVGYIVAVAFWIIPSRRSTVCKQVQVEVSDANENSFVTQQDIFQMLKQQNINLVGLTFEEIPMRSLEEKLMKNAALREVECYQTTNATLLIKVKQRKPVFRVMSGSANYYVDNERKTMPTILRHTAYVPIVTGNVTTEFACGQLYDFVQYIESNTFLSSQFSQINVYANQDVELIPRVGAQTILLGELDNYESKLKKLEIFYKKAMDKVGWDTYSRIDLQYKDQVVCTRR